MSKVPGVRSLAVVACGLLCACRPAPPRTPVALGSVPVEVTSNILRGDYAGSEACRPCHPTYFHGWQASPMRNMTRLPDGAQLHARWDGLFRFKDDSIRFEQIGGERYMRIESPKDGAHLYRVSKLIGGHHREDFAGVEVDPAAPERTVGDPRIERVLPATWMIEAGEWRYKGYSVMTPERPGLRAGAVWSRTCIFCHNTEPYLDDLLGALSGFTLPPYQGEVVDDLLPEARRFRYRITDEAAFRRAMVGEIGHLGGRQAAGYAAGLAGEQALLAEGVKVTRARFFANDLIEVGIGCEACHGGCRQHVAHMEVSPVLEPRAPFLAVDEPPAPTPAIARAQRINHLCARCHQVLFSQYPFTWEGGLRSDHPPGGAHINSGEARDLLLGACTGMSCVDCHDPHAPDNQARMKALDGPAGSAVCVRCHSKYSGAQAVRAHTHHDPSGAGAQCLNCHMPKKNMSLDNRLGRYHRVGSPDDPVKVEGDRPLECALCHGDKSVGELVTTMEKWWGKRYDRDRLIGLYGSLDANVMLATLERGKPHEQAVALYDLGERKVLKAAPLVAAQLTQHYPIIRYYADRALGQILGRPVGIDLFQDDARIRAAAERLLATPAQTAAR